MSNLITQMNPRAAARNAAAAARNAAAARDEATKAKNASEERLETSGSNPFIVFNALEMEDIKQPGFFSKAKKKLSQKGRKLSVKKSDIAYLSENEDSFGSRYTVVNLESRCDLVEMDDITFLRIAGSIEETEAFINSK